MGRYEDLEKQINKLSDRLYEAEADIKVMCDRETKLIKRLLDAEEMIEQLGTALMKRRK